jgi:hypothetical protein
MIDKKPEIRKFTALEAVWLAAVIDGEGSFGLYNYGKEGRRVLIQMGNTSRPFVKEMRRIIGCGSSILRIKFAPSHKGRKPIHQYALKGSARCYWVLKQIVKYLIIKKKKALSIMKELESKPFGRWANATNEERKRASKTAILGWKNPKIRAARLKGMKEAKCRERS